MHEIFRHVESCILVPGLLAEWEHCDEQMSLCSLISSGVHKLYAVTEIYLSFFPWVVM
ncbi:MAG: hypothetical protein KDD35_07735 [Bdellovibrionales bacterium]|nr:hypothetical protein [Bdellovibrionales bacterium]